MLRPDVVNLECLAIVLHHVTDGGYMGLSGIIELLL